MYKNYIFLKFLAAAAIARPPWLRPWFGNKVDSNSEICWFLLNFKFDISYILSSLVVSIDIGLASNFITLISGRWKYSIKKKSVET